MSDSTIKRPKRGRPARRESPTIRDVAQHAGVGIATVSRVINRSSLVTAEKTEKVLQVIQEIGYKASPLGRRPRKRRKGAFPGPKHQAVCMLLIGPRWITNCAPVYAYVLESVESALRTRKIDCLIRNVHAPSELESLERMRVDGFFILGAGSWREWPADLLSYPSVSVLGEPASGWGDCVTYNNASTGKLAAEYLLSRGCRHAAIVGVVGQDVFSTRREGFARVMQAGGADVSDLSDDSVMRAPPDVNTLDEQAVSASIDALMEKNPRPDGLFITSDVVAPPVYRELERRGLAPGPDIQIVTCNNEKAYLSQLRTQPAVVDLQSGLIGVQAVDTLFWRLQNPDAPRQSVLIEPVLRPPSV